MSGQAENHMFVAWFPPVRLHRTLPERSSSPGGKPLVVLFTPTSAPSGLTLVDETLIARGRPAIAEAASQPYGRAW